MGKLKPKAQAAMDYLLSYGWALLAVIALLIILWYFDLLHPSSLLPNKCTVESGFVCQDAKLSSQGKSMIQLFNNLGSDVKVKEIEFISDGGEIKCVFKSDFYCDNGGLTSVTLRVGTYETFCSLCLNNDNEPTTKNFYGSKVKGKLKISFTNLQTLLEHITYGSLFTRVEKGVIVESTQTSATIKEIDSSICESPILLEKNRCVDLVLANVAASKDDISLCSQGNNKETCNNQFFLQKSLLTKQNHCMGITHLDLKEACEERIK